MKTQIASSLLIGLVGCATDLPTEPRANLEVDRDPVVTALRDLGPLGRVTALAPIAFDAQGRLNIVGSRWNAGHTKHLVEHGVFVDGTWHWSTVATTNVTKHVGGFAIDSQGALHVAFSDVFLETQTQHELTYATRAAGGGAWTLKTLDRKAIPACARAASPCDYETLQAGPVLVDAQHRPHVIYSRVERFADLGHVHHATRTNGTWSIEAAGDATGDAAQLGYVAAAIDGTGAVQVAFPGEDSTGVVFARRGPTGWSTQTVSEDLDVSRVSLALDPAGNAHVAVGDYENVRVFRRAPTGVFSELPVAPNDNFVGDDLKIVIDGSNRLHLFSLNGSAHDGGIQDNAGLSYARFDGTRWSPLKSLTPDGHAAMGALLRNGTFHLVVDENHGAPQGYETTYLQYLL